MKKSTITTKIAAYSIIVLAAFSNVQAMELKGEKKAISPVYAPTKSAVKKTLTKMGVDFTVDDDGDLRFETGKTKGYIILNETSSGRLWNINIKTGLATKKSRYDDLLKFSHEWNKDKKVPKVYMKV